MRSATRPDQYGLWSTSIGEIRSSSTLAPPAAASPARPRLALVPCSASEAELSLSEADHGYARGRAEIAATSSAAASERLRRRGARSASRRRRGAHAARARGGRRDGEGRCDGERRWAGRSALRCQRTEKSSFACMGVGDRVGELRDDLGLGDLAEVGDQIEQRRQHLVAATLSMSQACEARMTRGRSGLAARLAEALSGCGLAWMAMKKSSPRRRRADASPARVELLRVHERLALDLGHL